MFHGYNQNPDEDRLGGIFVEDPQDFNDFLHDDRAGIEMTEEQLRHVVAEGTVMGLAAWQMTKDKHARERRAAVLSVVALPFKVLLLYPVEFTVDNIWALFNVEKLQKIVEVLEVLAKSRDVDPSIGIKTMPWKFRIGYSIGKIFYRPPAAEAKPETPKSPWEDEDEPVSDDWQDVPDAEGEDLVDDENDESDESNAT